MYWNKLCALLGNVGYMLYTTCPQSHLWVSVSVVMRCLTCRGRWLDVDRGWFNHRKHGCLQGLEDNSLGLYGSLGMSQGHSCNHGFWLDGDLGPNLDGPLGWQRLLVWCLNHGDDGWGGGVNENKFKVKRYENKAALTQSTTDDCWTSTLGGPAGLRRFFGRGWTHRIAAGVGTLWHRRELRLWWEGLILDGRQRTNMRYIMRT